MKKKATKKSTAKNTIVKGTFHDMEIPKDRKIVQTDKLKFPWKEDKKGYFLIKVDKDEIQCGFLENRKMTVEFRGKDPYNMIKEIAQRNMINLEHMGYLASELTRAKECIDYGRVFIQR